MLLSECITFVKSVLITYNNSLLNFIINSTRTHRSPYSNELLSLVGLPSRGGFPGANPASWVSIPLAECRSAAHPLYTIILIMKNTASTPAIFLN